MMRMTRRALLGKAALVITGCTLACRQRQQPSATPEQTKAPASPSATPSPTRMMIPAPAPTTTLAPVPPVTVTIDAIENCFTRFAIEQSASFSEGTGINVAWRSVTPWHAYQALVDRRAAAGDLDIIQAPIGLAVQAWARFGYLRPFSAYTLPSHPATRGMFPGAIAACSLRNQLYGLPFAASPGDCLLLYNPLLFAQAGVQAPSDEWTLEDLVTAAERLNMLDSLGRLEQYGYVPQYPFPGYHVMLRIFGTSLLDEGGSAISPQALYPVLDWYNTQLHEKLVYARPFELASNPLSLFHHGKAAMIRLSFGTLVELSSELEWVQAALIPPFKQHGKRGSCLSGLASCIAASSPKPIESTAWCQFLSSAEMGVQMFEQGCGIAGCYAISWQDERVTGRFPISAECAALAMQAQPEPVPQNLRQSELYQAWLATGEPFWNGRVSPDQFADTFTLACQRVLQNSSLGKTDQL